MNLISQFLHIIRVVFVFPSTPFLATLNSGAQAYSPDGVRPWGNAITNPDGTVMVVRFLRDKAVVGSPLWSNGKQWAVLSSYVVSVDNVPEPPNPDPEPEPEPEPEPPVDYHVLTTFYTDGTPPKSEKLVPLVSGE